ncbi:MAG: NIL domain-containing protein [Deferrisomatales bacterium]
MEIAKNVLLIFRPEVMYQPVIYRLAREFDLVFNILEAKILPRLEGRLILELRGTEADVARGVRYLEDAGVEVTPIAENISRDEERCVHCGACTAVCRTGALDLDRATMEVRFLPEKCAACGQCELACPMKALAGVNIERLGTLAGRP